MRRIFAAILILYGAYRAIDGMVTLYHAGSTASGAAVTHGLLASVLGAVLIICGVFVWGRPPKP